METPAQGRSGEMECALKGPWRVVAFGGVAVLLLFLASACSRSEGTAGGPRGRAAQLPSVSVIAVTPTDLMRTVTVTGPVEPVRKVLVSSQTSGTVLRVAVEEGHRVRSGELMAELDAREATAQLERAKAVLVSAKAAFERAEQLQSRNLTSAAEFDGVRAAYEIAKADVELWTTRVAFCRIEAPVSGVVTSKSIERGSAVSTNEVMFAIDDDSEFVVRARVSELDVVHLSAGRRVPLQLDAYPGVELSGKIRRIFPAADAASRLVPVEVVLDRPSAGVEIRSGFLARMEFVLERREDVLAVPAAAVGVVDQTNFVYVVDAGTLSRRQIETGLTASGWIEVRSGLAAQQQVVSSGHMNLRDGMAVRISGASGETTADE
jgi:RND family efflux transporter MFP subunit